MFQTSCSVVSSCDLMPLPGVPTQFKRPTHVGWLERLGCLELAAGIDCGLSHALAGVSILDTGGLVFQSHMSHVAVPCPPTSLPR